METNLKKLLPIVGVMLASFNLVNADQFNNNSIDDMNGAADANSKYRACPTATHVCDDAWGVFVYGDYILWTPRAQLNVATSGIYPEGTAATTAVQGSVIYPEFNLLSGFRVGLGVNLDHDKWDVKVDYTWLRQGTDLDLVYGPVTDGDSTAFSSYALATGVSPNDGTQVDEIYSSWAYQFNNIDLDAGRDFFVGHYFTLRPHLGLKFAWTKNTVQNEYQVVISNAIKELEVYNQQKFWGVGIRTGLDSTFFFDENWMIYGTTAFSLPWSKFQITQLVSNETDELTNITFTNDFYATTPVVELGMGLRWVVKFGDENCYAFALQVGWDEQVWFNQVNWLAGPVAVPQGGQLSQQGLSVRARFDF